LCASVISHMLEIMASSRDKLLRVGRWVLIAYPCLRRRLHVPARSLFSARKFPQRLVKTTW
jgi:hypothetical protein